MLVELPMFLSKHQKFEVHRELLSQQKLLLGADYGNPDTLRDDLMTRVESLIHRR